MQIACKRRFSFQPNIYLLWTHYKAFILAVAIYLVLQMAGRVIYLCLATLLPIFDDCLGNTASEPTRASYNKGALECCPLKKGPKQYFQSFEVINLTSL